MIKDISRCPTCGDWWCNYCDDHYADCACPSTDETNDIDCGDGQKKGYSAMLIGAVEDAARAEVLKQVTSIIECQLEDLEGELVRCEISLSTEQYGTKCAVYGTLERKEEGVYRVLSSEAPPSYCYFRTQDVLALGLSDHQSMDLSPLIKGKGVIYLRGTPVHPWGHVIADQVEEKTELTRGEGAGFGLVIFDEEQAVIICVPNAEGDK